MKDVKGEGNAGIAGLQSTLIPVANWLTGNKVPDNRVGVPESRSEQ